MRKHFASTIDPSIFDQFTSKELAERANADPDFAMSLFDYPETLKRIVTDYLFRLRIGDSDMEFLTKLYLETDLLDEHVATHLSDLTYLTLDFYPFAMLLTEKPAALEKMQSEQLQAVASKNHHFAEALVEMPDIIKKLSSNVSFGGRGMMERFNSLICINQSYSDFINKLVKSRPSFAMLDSKTIRHRYSNTFNFNISALRSLSPGFKTCHDLKSFKRATTTQPEIFNGTFAEFKDTILDNLAGYNAHIYLLPESNDETPPIFSHEHLREIIQCKSADELRNILNTVKAEIEKSEPKKGFGLHTLFESKSTSNHLDWLEYNMKLCDQYRLNWTETERALLNSESLSEWLGDRGINNDLPISLSSRKISLVKPTTTEIEKTYVENLLLLPVEVEDRHWVAVVLHVSANNKILSANCIDPATDKKSSHLDQLSAYLKKAYPSFDGNIEQLSLGNASDPKDSYKQMPVLLRSLVKRTLIGDEDKDLEPVTNTDSLQFN